MTTQDQLPSVRPARLPDGKWGIQSDIELQQGARVQCTSGSGKQWDATVGQLVKRTPWGHLYAAIKHRTSYEMPRSAGA